MDTTTDLSSQSFSFSRPDYCDGLLPLPPLINQTKTLDYPFRSLHQRCIYLYAILIPVLGYPVWE